MKNIMEFEDGYKATISYDPDIEMFRGEFQGLNGGADFYGRDPESLKREGMISLKVFLKACEEEGIPPRKSQGKYALRLSPDIYGKANACATSKGMSLNAFISKAVEKAVNE